MSNDGEIRDINILIADDQPDVRSALRLLLEQQQREEVGISGIELLNEAGHNLPRFFVLGSL